MNSRNFLETKLATHLKPVFWANDYAGGHGNPSHEHGGAQSPSLADTSGEWPTYATCCRKKKGPISSVGSILAIEKYWALRGSFALLPACARRPCSSRRLRPAARWRSTGGRPHCMRPHCITHPSTVTLLPITHSHTPPAYTHTRARLGTPSHSIQTCPG